MTTRDSLAARFAAKLLPVSTQSSVAGAPSAASCGEILVTHRQLSITLLAVTALDHDLYLVTRNMRDVRHSGVAVSTRGRTILRPSPSFAGIDDGERPQPEADRPVQSFSVQIAGSYLAPPERFLFVSESGEVDSTDAPSPPDLSTAERA